MNTFITFFSRDSGLKVSVNLGTPDEIVKLAQTHWDMGMRSAILVTQPVSQGDDIPKSDVDKWDEQARKDAKAKEIRGQALTPFLLQRINELSGGRSLRANLSLLLNNARLAAQIAKSMAMIQRQKYA